MDLAAQISAITIPQEFSRLCTMLMAAEHGEEFLAIDDDRPDRGNDGYLKPQARLYAVHCFKRTQNQSVDALIRRKMLGDLAKATELKRDGSWPIEAWTFVCNYPIPENIATEVVALGRESSIDVSWLGPDDLAAALQRHDDVRAQFPRLQVNEVAEHLAELEKAVASAASGESECYEGGVPRTPGAIRELVRLRPPGWEYYLFAGLLHQGKEELELRWHDHNMPPYTGEQRELTLEESSAYLSRRFGALAEMVSAMERISNPKAQEMAFGAPGEDGDPVRIEHLASRIVDTYAAMLDWAAEIRSIEPAPVSAPMFEVAERFADRPMQQIRAFIDDAVEQVERLPEILEHATAEDPAVIRLQLNLSLDEELSAELGRRSKRAQRKIKWGF